MIDGGKITLLSPAAGAHGIRGHRACRSKRSRRDDGGPGLLPFLGAPEGELALAEATLYLATAPSPTAYVAWRAAMQRARETTGESVPLHIRNAPTGLMKELGYGKGYRYDPEEEDGVADQRYLPDRLAGERFYEPGPYGEEAAESGSGLSGWPSGEVRGKK